MSDKLKGITITFDHNMNEEQADALINAIKMFKGVLHVEPSIVTGQDHMNRTLIKAEFLNKIFKLISDELNSK